MNWFLAKIIFRIVCGNGMHTPQFDKQLRLIQAEDETKAYEKACLVGEQEQVSFLNHQEQLIQWKFINVSELYKLSALIDGAELYSRVQEVDDADHYIGVVNKKAAHIKEKVTHQLLQLF
ncbi:MAG TPA: DUF4288 domain-containing protein [Flavitalea sp.]|nr:DUF4288 domain-containing protein [Flavitalea sp.]